MPELNPKDWPVADWQSMPLADGQLALWWLGQAGFALRMARESFVIDPYLSDSLAAKYAGAELPHVRMMPGPLRAAAAGAARYVLCTHAHTDHMDGATLAAIARANPACRFIVPQAAAVVAVARGLPAEYLLAMDDGQAAELGTGIAVEAVAAAHEQLETDDAGHYHFLGYLLHLGAMCVYHSGDCVPHAGLETRLADRSIDLALLPVNGRDEYRRARHVPGNFHFAEAVALCERLGIPLMLAHHFGMFDFNTVDPDRLREQIAAAGLAGRVILPEIDKAYLLSP